MLARAALLVALTGSPIVAWLALGPTVPEGTYFLISRLGTTAADADASHVIYSFARSWSFVLVGWTLSYPLAYLLAGFIAHALFNASVFALAYLGTAPSDADSRLRALGAAAFTLLVFPLGLASGLGGGAPTLIPQDAYHSFSIRTLFWAWMAVVYVVLIQQRFKTAVWAAAAAPLLHPNAGLLAFGMIGAGALAAGWRKNDRSLEWHILGALVVAALPALITTWFTDTSALGGVGIDYAAWYSRAIKDEADDFSFIFHLLYRSTAVAAITATILVTVAICLRVFPSARRDISVWSAVFVVVLFYLGAAAEALFAVWMPTPLIHLIVGLTPGYRMLSFAFFPLAVVGTRLIVATLGRAAGHRRRVAPTAVATSVAVVWLGLMAAGFQRGSPQASLAYGQWALRAGHVDGIDAYLEAASRSGRPAYFAPPLFDVGDAVITYPHERNLLRIRNADESQPEFTRDRGAAERFTSESFVAIARAVRASVPKGAGLIVPPYLRYFRDALVDHAVFFQEHHDGNLMLGHPRFLGFWEARMHALLGETYETLPSKASGLSYSVMRRAYLSIDTAAAADLYTRYPAYRYLVTERHHVLRFATVLSTGEFVVYDLGTAVAGR